MKRLIFLPALLIAASLCVFAQSPRFKGLALGGCITGNFMLGDYADIAPFGAGGGLCAEYTAFNFSRLDAGFSVRGEFSHVFPKSEISFHGGNDLILAAGAFVRVPFGRFALQPELDYGATLHFARGKDGAYFDQIVRVGAALRYVPQFAPKLEFELAPQFSLSPEKEGRLLMQADVRLGAVWHFRAL